MRSYLHYVNREVQERRQSSDSNMSFCLNESIWIGLKVAESEVAFWFFFFFFFFLFQPHYLTKSIVNSARMHYSLVPQISLFNNFFIINESYGTVYSVFSFSKNKLNPNDLNVQMLKTDINCRNSNSKSKKSTQKKATIAENSGEILKGN